jgi:predicted regulator of Ras-like GTPase activity (Roadblock/LC7/MglB family)
MADTLGWAITEEQSRKLNTSMADLLVMAEADGVFMTDWGGNLIAYSAPGTHENSLHNIAALAAGSFVATRELAALIGETGFQSMFQNGENASIYIHCVSDKYLILVIFNKNTTAGLVKLYVERATQEILPVVKIMENQSVESAGGGHVFEFNEDSKIF